jgi:MoaA/NifB/PqqE/SkfB family radical SAM enzyme
MRTSHVLRAWKSILVGRAPSLSIEITRECPLRCPGCYAYEDAHLGGGITLRQLSDFKGDELVGRVLAVVDELRPLHLSIVGGDPLVRYRELERIVPQLLARGIHVQVVTSAFRPLPAAWIGLAGFTVAVSVDGLQPEHDERRKPATYDRILKNVEGHRITIHCTITSQMMRRDGYLDEFLRFWDAREEVSKIWFSLFTPQRGDYPEERLTKEQRISAVNQLMELRDRYPKADLPPLVLRQFLKPPESPADCIFARTTQTISADLKTRIGPCQFGGDPDCTECGCYASMGLAAVGDVKLANFIPVGAIFRLSSKIGGRFASWRPEPVLLTATPVADVPAARELVTISSASREE